MKRRRFLYLSAAFTTVSLFLASCRSKLRPKAKMVGASAAVGHLLRDGKFEAPTEVIAKKVVIVGAGISGLSAARHLKSKGITDFQILDLESEAGGNARSGRNDVSAYPWGAHYVPTPNNALTEYVAFLQECGVVTGFDAGGLPVYNEYYLCFDPQERLYINGQWQDGLVPHYSLPKEDTDQVQRFLALMDNYRRQKGSDGKDAFALPVDISSKDIAYVELDSITMKDWLTEQGFTSTYLHWYVNYCTRDDFGTPHNKASAWAGIHYFACRKGEGANATHSDVLTWPEGNGFLVKQLAAQCEQNLSTGALVFSVKEEKDGILITYYDVATKRTRAIKSDQCILAVPQLVAARLLDDEKRKRQVAAHFQYAPWVVANLKVSALEERTGAPLSWDNVIYDSPALGYVHATHELLNQRLSHRNLTYYWPLTEGDAATERRKAHYRDGEEWADLILADLKRVHPNIETAIEEINVMVWGHAMVQPLPGTIHGPVRKHLAASINNRIHFAHTDLAGVSLFEEAFYQGLAAAKKITG